MPKRDGTGLGRSQVLVLRLLALQAPCSARDLAYHWPSLTESSARSAVDRLAMRGLVDLGPHDHHNARTFVLTTKGAEVESQLSRLDDEDDDA